MLSVHDKSIIEDFVFSFLLDQSPLDYSREQILSYIHDDVQHNLSKVDWDEIKKYLKNLLEYHSKPGKRLEKDKRNNGIDRQEIYYYKYRT